MDDANWPIDGYNVLNFVSEIPWPGWFDFSVYQPLISVNLTAEYQTNNIQYLPILASNWTVSADQMTYTINLRPNINFSNGDPFNAYQEWMELYGFYYLSANSSGFWQSYSVFNMSNVSFGPATIALINQSGLVNPSPAALQVMTNSSWPIYVTGPYQIVFHLKAPFLYFLGTLVSYIGMSFDTQYVLDHGGFGTPASFNTYFNTNPIPGTGPYLITGQVINSYMTFAQNPTYWGDSLPASQVAANPLLSPGNAKTVIINYKPDDLSRYTDLSTGTAQIVAIESADWNQILANPSKYSYTVLPSWAGITSAVALNVNEYPTNITLVRQAIVHAINYTDVASAAFAGQMAPGMGPEYPAFPQFYDLGNFTPYQYNLTLAQNDLNQANIANMPALTFKIISGCVFCETTAEVVQADLAQIGITVNIQVLASSTYYSGTYGSYSTNVQDAAQIGQLSLLGGETWAPSALTPADNWVSFMSNVSGWGNWAGYSTPDVQACINAFTSSANVSYIQNLCKVAQAEIYNDAPYAWIGFYKLWYSSGSLVWQTGVVKGFLLDPVWGGIDTMPIINTVTFG
jgi:peptide/nickel transport system substrate-binding protein